MQYIVQIKEDINVRQQEEESTGAVVDIQSGSGLIKLINHRAHREHRAEMLFSVYSVISVVFYTTLLDAEQTCQVTGIDLAKERHSKAMVVVEVKKQE